jgi:hypothetical protein
VALTPLVIVPVPVRATVFLNLIVVVGAPVASVTVYVPFPVVIPLNVIESPTTMFEPVYDVIASVVTPAVMLVVLVVPEPGTAILTDGALVYPDPLETVKLVTVLTNFISVITPLAETVATAWA